MSFPGLFPFAVSGGGFSEKGMTAEAPSRLATRFDDDPGRGRNVSYFFFYIIPRICIIQYIILRLSVRSLERRIINKAVFVSESTIGPEINENAG